MSAGLPSNGGAAPSPLARRCDPFIHRVGDPPPRELASRLRETLAGLHIVAVDVAVWRGIASIDGNENVVGF